MEALDPQDEVAPRPIHPQDKVIIAHIDDVLVDSNDPEIARVVLKFLMEQSDDEPIVLRI